MPYLHETMTGLRSAGYIKAVPEFLPRGLNPDFTIRPYQAEAFENFITYYENEHLRQKPTQVLFHMATGSGKTLIMAGLLLYLYQQGYRNFLFFVNLSNIVEKTRENFLNPASGKYLFADHIEIDGQDVRIREVNNFQDSDPAAINLCFTTTQKLHSDLWLPKESALSLDDFQGRDIVLISDEAHHLNADTRSLKGAEAESYHSWESTVRRIFEAGPDNILLEFTATCDLDNDNIRAAYTDKIIFHYPLSRFREDRYSKEIMTLRSDISVMERALQAVVLSQYRLKIFQDNRLKIKPVILFKAAKIADSKQFMKEFSAVIAALTGAQLAHLSKLTDNATMQRAYRYFAEHGVTFEQLAQELREDFSPEHCISANDETEAERSQLALNSLEDAANPYRAVFEVKKLDEGWDVLNLFDIVRLYETRQSGGKKISPATISEAQLIGRGARYCPFRTNEEQDRFRRKYDRDLDNPLRICEELYYHCQNDSRYIVELHRALREIGLDPDRIVTREYHLKASFVRSDLYREGYVFANERLAHGRDTVTALPAELRGRVYRVAFATSRSGEDVVMEEQLLSQDTAPAAGTYETTIGEIARLNYNIVHKALCRYDAFAFDRLRRHFPQLRSTREFILGPDYLGDIRLHITSREQPPAPETLCAACTRVLGAVAGAVAGIETASGGSRQFTARYVRDVFTDKRCNYTDPHGSGPGVSQNSPDVPPSIRLDLSREDWYAYEDNFGTSEEKEFVAYFKSHVDRLRERYDEVYLVRNERQLVLYSFEDGRRFEPDYVLFLRKSRQSGYEQLQIFIEPKGEFLIPAERWKEAFLLQLEQESVPSVLFADDNRYRIRGFHFFNQDSRLAVFAGDIGQL